MTLFSNPSGSARGRVSLFGHRSVALTASVALLALAVAAAPAVEGATKTKKPKKNQDLSANPLANVKSSQPDKILFDKAMVALKKGRFDVARLDLQTLLNTYPDSEYRMRAKLAVGDSWFKEGGSAALAQAESEYNDFTTFFPTVPEAAEAQMKIGDIYFMQMEKPDRDYVNAQSAEREYRRMIEQYPDSPLVPRARQKLREVQEVLAEREFLIGQYYSSKENWAGAIARLQTVADTYPLYSKSDEVWLTIGDSYAGEARYVQLARNMPAAVRERLEQVYLDKAAAAYGHVISHYPMAPRVEDARDRLVAMNRPVLEPSQQAVAENDAVERSRQPIRFTDKTLGLIKHGPQVVEAAHVGDPTMASPARTIAPDITKENQKIIAAAFGVAQPVTSASGTRATAANEPPRSDQPQAPLQFENTTTSGDSTGTNSVGASIISAPNSAPAASAPAAAEDPNAVVKAVKPETSTLPTAESASEAPAQINDIKNPVAQPVSQSAADSKKKVKAPKADLSDESSSKKKKKKGLSKLNPF